MISSLQNVLLKNITFNSTSVCVNEYILFTVFYLRISKHSDKLQMWSLKGCEAVKRCSPYCAPFVNPVGKLEE